MSAVTFIADSATVYLADAYVEDGDLRIVAADLGPTTGFELKPEGFCRDEVCYPVPRGREDAFLRDDLVNVSGFWRYRGGAVVSSDEGDVWVFGEPASDRANQLTALEAPDFTLPDVEGVSHSLSDYRGRKVVVFSWASWCGCRRDLAPWQTLYEELAPNGLTVVAVALDSEPGAPDPWIAEGAPTYPSLIDREHRTAELYNFVNVPQ